MIIFLMLYVCCMSLQFWTNSYVSTFRPTSDAFTLQVTLDIGSTFTDELEVRAILEQQLQYHSLGSVQVGPQGFTFRIFQGISIGGYRLTTGNDRFHIGIFGTKLRNSFNFPRCRELAKSLNTRSRKIRGISNDRSFNGQK